MKRQDHSNSYKGKHLTGADLQVQRLSSWLGEHDRLQVDTVLGKLLRLLHLNPQAEDRERASGPGFSF